MQQTYDDGKYTVIFNDKTGELKALRHREPWKNLSGDKLTYCMLAAHADAQAEIARLRGALERCREAFDSCTPGDYSTGHVIHPYFDEDAVNAAQDLLDGLGI